MGNENGQKAKPAKGPEEPRKAGGEETGGRNGWPSNLPVARQRRASLRKSPMDLFRTGCGKIETVVCAAQPQSTTKAGHALNEALLICRKKAILKGFHPDGKDRRVRCFHPKLQQDRPHPVSARLPGQNPYPPGAA